MFKFDAEPNSIESFIIAVESRPCLYNKTDAGYSNKDVKSKAWAEVCETVVPGWDYLSDPEKTIKGREIQQRWTNLRHSFLRELREQRKNKTGQSAKKRRKYIYYDQLLFLLPTMEQKDTGCEFQQEEDETAESQGDGAKESFASSSGDHNVGLIQKSLKKKRTYEQKLLDILCEKKEKTEELDEDKLFLLSLLPALKRLPSESKLEAKMELMRTIHRYEHCDHSLRQILPDTHMNSQPQYCQGPTGLT